MQVQVVYPHPHVFKVGTSYEPVKYAILTSNGTDIELAIRINNHVSYAKTPSPPYKSTVTNLGEKNRISPRHFLIPQGRPPASPASLELQWHGLGAPKRKAARPSTQHHVEVSKLVVSLFLLSFFLFVS